MVPREIKDPRVPYVTFTRVEVTPDGAQATVYVMIFGLESADKGAKKRMDDCLAGLTSAAGYLRRHLAGVLTIRHIPTLLFKEDKGLINSTRVHELLKEIDKEPKEPKDSK